MHLGLSCGSSSQHSFTTRQNAPFSSPPDRPPMAYPGKLRCTWLTCHCTPLQQQGAGGWGNQLRGAVAPELWVKAALHDAEQVLGVRLRVGGDAAVDPADGAVHGLRRWLDMGSRCNWFDMKSRCRRCRHLLHPLPRRLAADDVVKRHNHVRTNLVLHLDAARTRERHQTRCQTTQAAAALNNTCCCCTCLRSGVSSIMLPSVGERNVTPSSSTCSRRHMRHWHRMRALVT